MDAKEYICPRTREAATPAGCAACAVGRQYTGVDCAVIRVMNERRAGKPAPVRAAEPAKKEDQTNPYAVSPRRRRIGCWGIALSLCVLVVLMWIDPLKAGTFMQGLGALALIMLPVSIYIAFPLFAAVTGTAVAGVVEGHTEAQALVNVAKMGKQD